MAGVVAVVAATLLLRVETTGLDSGVGSVLFPGSPQSARAVLTTVATSTLTLAGLLFSITMLVLQLSSSQYSPRVLRTFLADRNSHLTLAAFVGTFTYSVVVLRGVGSDTGATPGVAVTLDLLLGLGTLAVFVQFISHITGRIRVSSIVAAVGTETVRAVDRLADDPGRAAPPLMPSDAGRMVTAADSGVLVYVRVDRLAHLTRRNRGRVEVPHRVGDFVIRGDPLAEVWGLPESDDEAVCRAVCLGVEREVTDDPAYGVRQLTDIAERALSPSLNDPTTAVQCVSRLHEVLRRLTEVEVPTGHYADDAGVVRVSVGVRGWDDHLEMLGELVRHATAEPRVLAAIEDLVGDLLDRTDGDVQVGLGELRALVSGLRAERRSEVPGAGG